MPINIIKDEYPRLLQKLKSIEKMNDRGWTEKCAKYLNTLYLDHLENQGRGGSPPSLSDATRIIYEATGEPDGSGIRNHIQITYSASDKGSIAIFGIPEGKPSLVARVQDRGAVIPVTERMRGFLAHCGIFLKDSTTTIFVPGRHSWSESLEATRKYAISELRRFKV
jgi:hypothetical protein